MRLIECYRILNVSPEAEWEEVKRAYRALAKQFHPDRNPRASESQFKQISESFHRLELYYKKSNCSTCGNPISPQAASPISPQAANPGRAVSLEKASANKLMVLEKVMGFCVSRALRQWFEKRLDRVKQALFEYEKKVLQLDVRQAVTLRPAIAASGGAINIRTFSESFQVKLPAGIPNPFEMRIPGRGIKSLIKGRRGDFFLKLRIIPDGLLPPGSTNFFYEMEVSRDDIASGKVMTLNTIQGPIKFFVPRKTADERTLVLKAKPNDPAAFKINHVLTLRVT